MMATKLAPFLVNTFSAPTPTTSSASSVSRARASLIGTTSLVRKAMAIPLMKTLTFIEQLQVALDNLRRHA
jgi:hypothetical protein